MGNQNKVEGLITKKYVQISNVGKALILHGNLEHIDLTDPKSTEKDRLKVHQLWTKVSIKIENGVHWYPGIIAQWPVVKTLVSKNILTIGGQSDSLTGDEANVAKEREEQLNKGLAEQERQKKVSQNVSGKKETKKETEGSMKSLSEIAKGDE